MLSYYFKIITASVIFSSNVLNGLDFECSFCLAKQIGVNEEFDLGDGEFIYGSKQITSNLIAENIQYFKQIFNAKLCAQYHSKDALVCISDHFNKVQLHIPSLDKINWSNVNKWIKKQKQKFISIKFNSAQLHLISKSNFCGLLLISVGTSGQHRHVKQCLLKLDELTRDLVVDSTLTSSELKGLDNLTLKSFLSDEHVHFISKIGQLKFHADELLPNHVTMMLQLVKSSIHILNESDMNNLFTSNGVIVPDRIDVIITTTSRDMASSGSIELLKEIRSILHFTESSLFHLALLPLDQINQHGHNTSIPLEIFTKTSSYLIKFPNTQHVWHFSFNFSTAQSFITNLLDFCAQKYFNLYASREFTKLLRNFRRWILRSSKLTFLDEGPLGSLCYATSHNLTNPFPTYPPRKLQRNMKMYYGLPLLTPENWNFTINENFKFSFNESRKITVVVFLRDHCSSCVNNGFILRELYRNLVSKQFYILPTVFTSLYAVNCSAHQDFCLKVGARGYPSLVAFRSSNLRVDQCHLDPSTLHQLRFLKDNYFGSLTVTGLETWMRNVATSQIKELSNLKPQNDRMLESSSDSPKLKLVAETISYTQRKHRQRRGVSHLYPMTCFMALCETLYGISFCDVINLDEPINGDRNLLDLRVIRIRLLRSDGINTLIMSSDVPLTDTLEGNAGDTQARRLHSFHRAHRYNLTSHQTCESDHAACTDILFRFSMDHSRLPVNQLTEAELHKERSFAHCGFPLLVALVHTDNITLNDSFVQLLESVGRSLYSQVALVTLDVDMYPVWSAQFVPLHYTSRFLHKDNLHHPTLYHYPRFCLIDWTNHNQAAFYPHPEAPYQDIFTLHELTLFTTRILQDPTAHMQSTEHF